MQSYGSAANQQRRDTVTTVTSGGGGRLLHQTQQIQAEEARPVGVATVIGAPFNPEVLAGNMELQPQSVFSCAWTQRAQDNVCKPFWRLTSHSGSNRKSSVSSR